MTETEKFKRAKPRRITTSGKRVVASDEMRRAYEETIREHAARERDHARFLPEDLKGKR